MPTGGIAGCRSSRSGEERSQKIVIVPTGQVDDILSSPDVARQIWEHYSDIVFILDPDGNFLYINEAGEQITGRRRREWYGKHFWALLHPDDISFTVTTFEEALQGRRRPVEVRARTAAGDYVLLSISGTPIRDPGGELIGLFCIAHDVTQLRRTEEDVKRQNEILVALNSIGQDLAYPSETEKLLRRSLQTLVDILELEAGSVLRLQHPVPREHLSWGYDQPHLVCQCAEHGVPLHGSCYQDRTAIGDVLQIPDFGVRRASLAEVFPSEKFGFHICLPLVGRTKVEGFLHLAAYQPRELTETEGHTLRSVGTQIGVVLENARLYHSLLLQVDRFKALMKASQNILSKEKLTTVLEAIIEEAVRILRANRCAIYLRDRDSGELECALARGLSAEYITSVISRLDSVPEKALLGRVEPLVVDDLAEVKEAQRLAVQEGVHTVAMFPLETGHGVLGGIVFYHDAVETYSQGDLEIGQLLGHQVAIAVENAWHFEEAVKRANEVEAKNRELEEFVSIASHDLRSPLISIEGFATRFLQTYGEQLDDEGRRYLRRIAENTRYMYALIKSLLDLSRAASHTQRLQEIDLNEVLEEVVRPLEPITAGNGAQIVCHWLPTIAGDRVRILQVFANLLDNAIKYASPKRPLRVEVGWKSPDIFIRDNGVGIPVNRKEEVFRSLYRLHHGAEDGLGMGLSIVKTIVERHGGRIWVESDGRSGATFYVRFPRQHIVNGRPNP